MTEETKKAEEKVETTKKESSPSELADSQLDGVAGAGGKAVWGFDEPYRVHKPPYKDTRQN
jgi:hypothetical protein